MRKKIRILCPIAILPGWRPGEPRIKVELLSVTSGREVEAAIDPDTEIVYREAPDAIGPYVEQYHDADLSGIIYAREALKAENDGFDAVMIHCFAEPGMNAARELCTIPVMSAWCAAIHVASMLGNKFSIVEAGGDPIASPHGRTQFINKIRSYGMESKLASIRFIDVPPTGANPALLSEEELRKFQEKALEEAKKAIEEDGAEVIIAYAGSYPYLKEKLDVPVVSIDLALLKMTEAIVRMGLTHSKKAYPKPRITHTYYLSEKPPT